MHHFKLRDLLRYLNSENLGNQQRLNRTLKTDNASVAQLDRVLGYEPSGRRFESSRMHHFKHHDLSGVSILENRVSDST
ncbi:hypothetical protein XIS1_670021 [Xenorhabdus innexi]|uniref:Uncharacterized protein n=1 Tax=Xenorhabdus innexi TaxID=290109 RepID=A0A1N6N0F5_9GAMM|nr:hypothetical protein XIS1_670021 [Xenorhabdus innexi]